MADGIEILQESFAGVVAEDAQLHVIGQGYRFTEGPAWHAGQQTLYFSDIPSDTILRWTAADAAPQVWRRPSRRANGNTVDRQGRLVTCEHASRTVTRTDTEGHVTTLAATFEGRRLNSPNDVVVDAAGTIWFTDPPYGIKPEFSEQRANFVFRLAEGAAEPVAVVDHLPRPNGLCFSPDERVLYVANSDVDQHNIWRFDVRPDGTLTGGAVFATIVPGVPDGMRVDRDGRLWSTAGDGVHVFSPAGQLLGKIHTPRTAANCTFGGPDRRTLFITATDTVWAIGTGVVGLL
ncbi:MAG: SMP-30/gluconolactonase/LRE family protein [Planctomycetes bacterium]|mgnify:CR=1 FL=1|nr:SMP-30/gluconolactonase/LRE family protein [Planctomycetota bacterium]